MNPTRGKNGLTGVNESSQVAYPLFLLRPWAFCSVLFLSLLLGACESGPDLPSPAPEFAKAGLSGDWIPDPNAGGPEVTFTNKEGIAALKLTAKGERAFVGRRLDSSLMAGPYLRWAWYLETASYVGSGRHLSDATAPPRNPLRLRIAFRGGPREEEGAPVSPWTATGVPTHDRLLDLVWEWQPAISTQGGGWRPVEGDANRASETIAGGAHPGCSVPCIPIQKRLEDTGQWWLEAADLEKIYRRFWPEDYLREVHVVFVALVLEPSPVPTVGYLADLDFHR